MQNPNFWSDMSTKTQNKVKRLPARLAANLSHDDVYHQQNMLKNQVFGPKTSFNKSSLPIQPISGNLQKTSASYFPQRENRMSINSNRLSDVSEIIEEWSASDGTMIPTIPETKELQASSHYYFAQINSSDDGVMMYDRRTGKQTRYGYVGSRNEHSEKMIPNSNHENDAQINRDEAQRHTTKVNWNESLSSECEQAATTLSGGEAQRVKLAKELSKRDTGQTLYILDEPTTGLHFHDIKQLLAVLHRLRDHGNTVVVIEHNLDVIKTADWIVDLGPEGGSGGGQIIAEGTPEHVAQQEVSHTGRFLKPMLNQA